MERDEMMEKVEELSTCGVLVLDPQDMVVHASGIVGGRLLSTPGKPARPLATSLDLPPEVLDHLSQNAKRAFSRGERFTTSLPVQVDGSSRLWAFTFSPTFQPSGRPDAMVITAFDTGASVPKRGSSKDLTVLDGFERLSSGSVVVVRGDDLIIRFLNGAALASLGGRKVDLIGKSVKKVLPDGGWVDHFLRVATTGEPIMGTGSIGEGSPCHRVYHWLIVPTNEEAGGELALIIIDSTDQMQEGSGGISGGMIQERRMLKTIVDTMPSGMIIADRDGRIWHSNRLAEFLLSPTRAGSPEQSLFEGADQDDRRKEIWDWPLFEALHHDQTTLEKEVRVRGSSGEVRTMLASAAPLRSEDGSLLGAVSVFQDITEMKYVEEKFREQTEELKRSNAELQHFAYIASHDLKEPLRMVVSYVQLLNKHYGDRIDGKGRDYIRYAAEGAERMKEMVDDLLEYSRVGSGNELFSQVDMMKVAQKVKEDLRISIGETGASVSWGELPTITAVESQMIKLLENLVGNSIKYHDVAAPQIEVSARMAGISWLFSVKDNGIGIDPRHADRLFKMFQRLHSRDEYPGTGMGLALARRIVERHGGSIWYESEAGKGTTFFFTIPVDRRIGGRINNP